MTRQRGGQTEFLRQPVRRDKKTEIKSFTGMRGLAVLFVMLFHWFPQTIKGGYLGVVVFMVLSGYLVTSAFLSERSRRGRISLVSFYARRLRRIYPPLLAFLLLLNAYLFFSGSALSDHFGSQAVSTLLGYNNWYQIGQKLSYFDQGGSFNALTHMWTLSIDLQIYLVWPILMAFMSGLSKGTRGKRRVGFRGLVFILSTVLTLLSYIALVFYFFTAPSPMRAYYGTDTRFFAFSLGAMLATIFSRPGLRRLSERLPATALNRLGIPLLLLSLLFFFVLSGQSGFTYAFGLFFFALVTMVLLALAGGGKAFVAAFFRLKPLQFLGRRSYSLYLWQYALMIVWRDLTKYSKMPYGLTVLFQVPVLLLLAELSYRLIEQGGGRLWHRFFRAAPVRQRKQERQHFFLRRGLAALPVAFLVALFVISLARSPLTADRLALQAQLGNGGEEGVSCAIGFSGNYEEIVDEVNRAAGLERLQHNDGSDIDALFKDVEKAYPELVLKPEETDRLATKSYLCIGDSVSLGTEEYLKKILPELRVKASVSLQFGDGLDLLQAELAADTEQPDILYFLGTNGLLEADQIDRLAQAYPDRNIYLMTIIRPEADIENRINSLLTERTAKYPNLKLLDWYQFAKTRGDIFFNDGVHPNQIGCAIYAHFVAKGLAAGQPVFSIQPLQ